MIKKALKKRTTSVRRGTVQSGSARPDERFQMAQFPFHWINRVSARYYLELEVALKRVGLDVPRWRVMIILDEIGAASVSELAQHAVIKLSTMTKLLQRMEADRLITLAASERDARVTEAHLTEAGRRAAASVRSEGQRVFAQAFAGVSAQDSERLVELLKRIFSNLESRSSP